jgi:hypothetical protein
MCHRHCPLAQSTGQLQSYYYLGISLNEDTQQWTWLDGTTAGNGQVSNANPYAHW